MSRIGKKPILIPENVEIKIVPPQRDPANGGKNQKVLIKGPKGEISQELPAEVRIEIKGKKIFILPNIPNPAFSGTGSRSQSDLGTEEGIKGRKLKRIKAFWGLVRSLLAGAIKGVVEGYEKKLQLEGVGFKANIEGEDLLLKIGFSHPVKIKTPQGIKFSVEKNIITISGINKQLVGQIAAKIRKIQPPEPYKGKGIRYVGEVIRRKVGKKVVATAT